MGFRIRHRPRRPALGITALWIVAAVGLPASGQVPDRVPDTALAQIQALGLEKRNRTPLERKLDCQLVFALRMSRGAPIAPGAPSIRPDVPIEADGRVLVDLDARVSDALLNRIRIGGDVVSSYASFNAVRARIPLTMIEVLAARTDVVSIRPADRATTHVGTLTSEGDVTHAAAGARIDFNVTGGGIAVGVLSDSVDFLGNSQLSGDLPAVTVLPGQSGVPGSGEGTAMLEIIHDLAPGADLYFATAFDSVAGFAQNILDLRAAGCDVIVDDVGYFNELPFQDGPIAQAVNTVTADGVLYFSSAANSGNKNDNTSGTWEGDFVDGGPAGSPINSGILHDFGAANFNTVASGGSARRVDLFWADPLGASTNDYDVYVLNSGGSAVLRASTNPQNGSQDPYEDIDTLNAGERIVIVKESGAPRFLHLSTGRARLTISTEGDTKGHSAAADAFSVAAVDADTSYPDAFGGGSTNPVETFSSDGPRRVFFEPDGTSITPGDFLSTGGAVRQKPDIAATDGVRTTVPDFDPFFGTSAAAPHAAAIAALVLSLNPSLTPAEVRAILTGTALDIEAPGVDRDSGWGIVMADAALQATPPFIPAPRIVGDGLTLVTETCVPANGAVDPDEIVTFDVALRNTGSANTTNLLATLQASPYIFPLAGPQFYGALSTNGSPVSSSFRCKTTAACGDLIPIVVELEDGTNQLGTITNLLTVGVIPASTSTSANPASIKVPSSGTSGSGSPYPSGIAVSGITSTVTKVTVTLNGVEHTFPDDMDVLLVGPAGQKVMLISDAGGGGDLNGVTLTFDDDAAISLPDATQIVSGTYKPTDYDPADAFPAPAPAGPYGTTLAAFAGTNPDGTWALYTADDAVPDKGRIAAGWSLRITAEDLPVCCTNGATSDLAIAKTVIQDDVMQGEPVVFILAVTNAGPDAVADVFVVDPLPDEVVFVSATPSQGSCTNVNGTVVCDLGIIDAGLTAGVTIVTISVASGAGTNTAWVAAAGSDPNASNDIASAAFIIEGDSDGDGMPDGYELANGLNPSDPSDALLDADGDGMINLDEFLAGTDLNDPLNVLRISGINVESNDLWIAFDSVSGKTYSVEANVDPTNQIWLAVETGLGATGPVTEVHNPGAATQDIQILRIRLAP